MKKDANMSVREAREAVAMAARRKKLEDEAKKRDDKLGSFDKAVEESMRLARKRSVSSSESGRFSLFFHEYSRTIAAFCIIFVCLFAATRVYGILFPANIIEESGFVTIADFSRANSFVENVLNGSYSKGSFCSEISFSERERIYAELAELRGAKIVSLTTADCDCSDAGIKLVAECERDGMEAVMHLKPARGGFKISGLKTKKRDSEGK